MSDTGRNMADLRISNRVAILNLLYSRGGMSRREIACILNLTPAAISLITSAMIDEGVLIETKVVAGRNSKGRREVILEINSTKYRIISAYIASREVKIACVDMAGNLYFRRDLFFDDNKTGVEILHGVCDAIQEYIRSLPQDEKLWIIGTGVGVRGIYDNIRGISVTSFGLWEKHLPISEIMRKRLGMKVLIDNNIRCVANAEMLFSQNNAVRSMLFIKQGPLIGSALILDNKLYQGHSFQAMELGHTIIDPYGAVCRCGKRGCLETVIGFDVLSKHLEIQYSASRMPILYDLTEGNASKITMEAIIESFDYGDQFVFDTIDGMLERFSLAIVNTVELINPQQIVFYGYPFESSKYLRLLKEKILTRLRGEGTIAIDKSVNNLKLDELGCASLVINDFLDCGAIYTPITEPALE